MFCFTRCSRILLVILISIPGFSLALQESLESLDVQATGHPARNKSNGVLNIATLNIAHGRGDSLNQLLVSAEKTRTNLSAIAATLQEKDIHIAALQEADVPSWWSGDFDHTAYIAERGEYGWYTRAPHADLGIGVYGTAVISTLPIQAAASLSFPPSPPTARKGFTLAEVHWQHGHGSTVLDVISIHMDFSRKSVRQEQLRELHGAMLERSNPLIIMGDFNSTGIARQLQREAADNGRLLHTVGDLGPEYHSYKDDRLDWILVSGELEFIDYHTDPGVLSDHRLVSAQLQLRSVQAHKE